MDAEAQNKDGVERAATPLTYRDIERGEGQHEGIGIRESGHGLLYHLKLCGLILLRSAGVDGDLSMTAEYKRLNPFDDIVIMSDIGGCKAYHLIQLKHAQARERTKRICSKDLLKEKSNNWKDQFTLQKYFKGYLKIRGMAEFGSARTNFIVLTNIEMDLPELKEQCISIRPWEDAHFTGIIRESKGKCYKLQSKGKSRVYEALVKGIRGVGAEDVKKFINDFVFAVNLPDEAALDDILKNEIGTMFNCVNAGLLKSELQDKLMEWLKQRTGCWLTREDANKCSKELNDALNSLASRGLDISGKLCERNTLVVEEHLIHVSCTLGNFLDSEDQLLQIVTENSYLTLVKIHQTINQGKLKSFLKKEVIFTRFNYLSSKESRGYIQSAMKSKTGHKLLVVHVKTKDKASRNTFRYLYKLIEICIAENKKIILITENEFSVSDLEEEYPDLRSKTERDDSVTFLQLTPDTQTSLLSRNVVTFLENTEKTNLAAIVDNEDDGTSEVMKIVDSDTLVHLVKHKEVKIGAIVQDIKVLSQVYVDRKLVVEGTANKITEDELLQVVRRVVIIHAEAGMGKSALFNSFLRKMRRDPFLWICRVNLNNYTKLFKEELENNRSFDRCGIDETIDFFVDKLLESLPETRLETRFEKDLFKLALKGYINVTLVFDAFDEICPNYNELVTSFLISLQRTKFNRFYVTSRPVGHSRRIELDGGLYLETVPLTEEDQSKFLTDYWAKELGFGREKLWILREIALKIKKEVRRTLLENPLTLFLFADYAKEIAWDIYNEVQSNTQIENEDYLKKIRYLPDPDLNEIYLIKYFVRKKFKIYDIDKSKQSVGNISSQNMNMFFMNVIEKFHTHLALETTFGERTAENLKGEKMPSDRCLKVELPKVGLVYEMPGGYNFLHSSFTDYYVLIYISGNSKQVGIHLDTKAWETFMQKMSYSMWDRVFDYISRGWLDRCLSEDLGRLRYACSYIAMVRRFRHKTTRELTGDPGPLIDPRTRAALLDVGLVVEGRPGSRRWAGLRFVYWRIAEYLVKDYVDKHRGEAMTRVSNYHHSDRMPRYFKWW